MIIIPAIDIKDGKCVRLVQGRLDKVTVFAQDPADMAEKWAESGAKWIHVVDLDGAVAKHPQHIETIRNILERVDVPVQLGGGIRSQETIQMYLEMGVKRIIIGSEAVKNPELVHAACRKFPGQIILAIDARRGQIAIDGWTHTTRIKALDLAKQFEDTGLAAINFTDIQRDGMQSGLNIEEIKAFAEAVAVPVMAAGGVSTLDDIKKILPLAAVGVTGVIVGRALYSGSLDFKKALGMLDAT